MKGVKCLLLLCLYYFFISLLPFSLFLSALGICNTQQKTPACAQRLKEVAPPCWSQQYDSQLALLATAGSAWDVHESLPSVDGPVGTYTVLNQAVAFPLVSITLLVRMPAMVA